jgi:hypothetical protein
LSYLRDTYCTKRLVVTIRSSLLLKNIYKWDMIQITSCRAEYLANLFSGINSQLATKRMNQGCRTLVLLFCAKFIEFIWIQQSMNVLETWRIIPVLNYGLQMVARFYNRDQSCHVDLKINILIKPTDCWLYNYLQKVQIEITYKSNYK